ncbi:Uma2 family endonuclease [Saccharopolyspora shandongensis]|uniref:Uma2 family endonuclease n=1 Tax=Saccharopolyspora shandongensis TaxID=418495 RepID=UPI0033D43720
MSAVAWPDHLLSLEDWAELPEDNSHRVELVEGTLHVSPRPVSDHQWALMELGFQLRAQLPKPFVALPEVEVVLFEHLATVRIPDLVVVPVELAKESPSRYRASDVVLAVEVVSPGSGRTDRVLKFAEYAEAGIPNYWIVDLEKPISLAAYELKNGRYLLVTESATTMHLEAPAQLTVDPAALLPR